MDLGFEFETGMIAIYSIADDNETLREIYRIPTPLDEHLLVSADDANDHTKKLSEPYHNTMLRFSGLFADKNRNRTLLLSMKTNGFSHLEFQYLKGYHELEDVSRLQDIILGDIRSASESIRDRMRDAVMGRLFVYNPKRLVPDFCYSRMALLNNNIVLLLRKSIVLKDDTVRVRFQEQMTVGTTCDNVVLIVGLLFHLFLERVPDGFSFQKSVFIESFLASCDDTDTTRSGIRWMLLYSYLTLKKRKISLFFLRCSMRKLLECFPDYVTDAVSFFRITAPVVRKSLIGSEDFLPTQTPEDYIQNIIDPTRKQSMVDWGTYFEPTPADPMILIEFRALHKILSKHLTLDWTNTGITVQTSEAK
jgi:hypothetical protein